jgi:hypothetical protein
MTAQTYNRRSCYGYCRDCGHGHLGVTVSCSSRSFGSEQTSSTAASGSSQKFDITERTTSMLVDHPSFSTSERDGMHPESDRERIVIMV